VVRLFLGIAAFSSDLRDAAADNVPAATFLLPLLTVVAPGATRHNLSRVRHWFTSS
jgi:hypothetical protein